MDITTRVISFRTDWYILCDLYEKRVSKWYFSFLRKCWYKHKRLLSARKYVAVGIRWRDRLINHGTTPSIPPSVGWRRENKRLLGNVRGSYPPTRYRVPESLTWHTRDHSTHTHTGDAQTLTLSCSLLSSLTMCIAYITIALCLSICVGLEEMISNSNRPLHCCLNLWVISTLDIHYLVFISCSGTMLYFN